MDLRWRPYRVECTGSLPTSEVKRRRARLVLGWGTAREDLRVLPAFVPACLHSSYCCNNVFRANMDLRWRPCRVECSGFISPKLSGAGPGAGRWPGKASSCCRLRACMPRSGTQRLPREPARLAGMLLATGPVVFGPGGIPHMQRAGRSQTPAPQQREARGKGRNWKHYNVVNSHATGKDRMDLAGWVPSSVAAALALACARQIPPPGLEPGSLG